MKSLADYKSVYYAFEQASAEFSQRSFLHAPASATAAYSDAAISFSYAESLQRARALAAAYTASGIVSGDRISLAFDSRLDVYLHLLALNSLGASVVPLNSSMGDAELAYIVDHSDSVLLVCADENLDRQAAIAESLHSCKVIGDREFSGIEGAALSPVGNLENEAALLYTSGTTGKPKGCILSNEYFLGIGIWYNALGGICSLDSSDRLLTALPPNHMNALATSFTAMMLCGGCVIQVDRFHPRSWWQTAREEGATVIHCLGVMVAILLTLDAEDNDDFSSQIKFCFGPGSDPKHQAKFEQRFGFPLIEAWAMTESGAGGMTIADREPRHVGERCIGKPSDTTDIRIVDENDIDVGEGESGQLLVRTKGDNPRQLFFSGYYKDDEATAEGWKGGWWRTGDAVRQGPDGSLFFVDRIKNVIRRSGENIAAVEVEAVLLQHAEVQNCAVCPVPDEIRGDEVFAFVIASPDAAKHDLIERLFEHCMPHLTYFKSPGYIAIVDELPLTASQKVSRGVIKTMARDSIAAGEAKDLRHLKKRRKS